MNGINRAGQKVVCVAHINIWLGSRNEILTPESARENSKLAFAYACEQYPWVIERQRHPLVLQP